MLDLGQIFFCANECHRQHSGELSVFSMANAFQWALGEQIDQGLDFRIDQGFILGVASRVDIRNVEYRTTPVRFANFSFAPNPSSIPRAMSQLLDAWNDPSVEMNQRVFVKSFLDIHPFVDGNGRTAAILYNIARGSAYFPIPLPDFYGGF